MIIGRELVKRLRLLNGRSESIRTRFEVDAAGLFVEHVVVETHDQPTRGAAGSPQAHLRPTRGRAEG